MKYILYDGRGQEDGSVLEVFQSKNDTKALRYISIQYGEQDWWLYREGRGDPVAVYLPDKFPARRK